MCLLVFVVLCIVGIELMFVVCVNSFEFDCVFFDWLLLYVNLLMVLMCE